MDASRLAGVTHLTVDGRGPRDAFVFDPHRLALPCWGLAGGGNLLITLDRHFDLVPPPSTPRRGLPALDLDTFARRELDVRNVDHLLAAMEAGVVSHAIVIARTRLAGSFTGSEYTDAHGEPHRIVAAPTVDLVAGQLGVTPAAREAAELIERAQHIVLDVDLDCFTTLSDVDPTAIVPWTEELIRSFLLPRGSEPFWDAVLAKCVALTIAREPSHCGGLVEAGRLFEVASRVVFGELLRADLP